jgi:hypothetical protein
MAFGYEYWIVYLPEFHLNSFLLFVHNPAGSTKLRDYSEGRERVLGQPGIADVRQATEWGRTRFEEESHTVSGHDGERYWQARIAGYNTRYLDSRKNEYGKQNVASIPPVHAINKMGIGRAKRGSQRQIQDYVNLAPTILNDSIFSALPITIQQNAPRIKWVSPLAAEQYRELRDAEFLAALGLGEYSKELSAFWPERGPCWDALGILTTSLQTSLPIGILVEAKSHVPEVYGNGCQAEGKSRALIEKSLNAAKEWCRARANSDWTGPLYQSANRIAHLHFIQQRLNRPCYLVNLYFMNDPYRPTSHSVWCSTLQSVHQELGLTAAVAGLVEVFLPGRPVQDDAENFSANAEIDAEAPNKLANEPAGEPVSSLVSSTPFRAASLNVNLSFAAWCKQWELLGMFQGPILPQPEKRIQLLIELWQQEIPGRWQRGIDPQLLGGRYRRGDLHHPHPGEHTLEHQILVERFGKVSLLGGTLIDGVNAFPLACDFAGGGRNGNVEADMLQAAQTADGIRLALCEVKADANDPWYAAVESLRQMRLYISNPVGRAVMQQRGAFPLGAGKTPITALVVAPVDYYRARGKKGNAVTMAKQLLNEMCKRFSIDIRLAVWDIVSNSILDL